MQHDSVFGLTNKNESITINASRLEENDVIFPKITIESLFQKILEWFVIIFHILISNIKTSVHWMLLIRSLESLSDKYYSLICHYCTQITFLINLKIGYSLDHSNGNAVKKEVYYLFWYLYTLYTYKTNDKNL